MTDEQFSALVCNRRREVLKAVSRWGVEDAEDVFHSGVMKILMSGSYREAEPKDPLAWLIQHVRYAYLDIRRRNNLTPEMVTLDELGDAEPVYEDCHARLDAEAVLGSVNEESAGALVMHYMYGYSLAEIARANGVSATAVQSRIDRAVARLRSIYRSDTNEGFGNTVPKRLTV